MANKAVMVATVAFAIGIDKPDVTRIINYGSPSCLESAVQQNGRLGRNGTAAVQDVFVSVLDGLT